VPLTAPTAEPLLDSIDAAADLAPAQSGGTTLSRLGEFISQRANLEGERGRSAQRYRRVALTALTSIFSKVIVLVTTIVSVPLTSRYLGAERYDLWMTITSSMLFLGFADFGIGNGLAAAIAQAHGKEDRAQARRQVSYSFFLLLFLAAAICVLLLPVWHFVPWNVLFGTKTALAGKEAGAATAILILCAALSMPLGTVLRVQTGYQQGYLGDLWNAAGNALALAGIFLVTRFGGGLPLLVAAVAGAPVLATACNWIYEFFQARPFLRPRFALFDRRTALKLGAVGGLFFLQQCFGLLYYVSDNMVIARTMGAAQVAQYAVLQRIFSIGLVAQYFMVPLWPAIAEALARRDYAWARRVIRRAIALSLGLGLLCGILLLAASRWLMQRWAGVDVGAIDSLRIGFALWVVLVGYVASMNAILNQPGTMRRHLMLFGGAAIVSLALKIVCAQHGSLPGVIWSTLVGFGIVYIIPSARLALRGIASEEEAA